MQSLLNQEPVQSVKQGCGVCAVIMQSEVGGRKERCVEVFFVHIFRESNYN